MLKVVAIGDLHVGSNVGLSIPDETPPRDQYRPVRDAIAAAYEEAVNGPFRRPDVLFVNGDAIDGQGPKMRGTEQWTADIETQVEMAAELIGMWKARAIYITRGSDYHVSVGNTGMAGEELLAQRIEAEPWPGTGHMKRPARSGWHLYVTVDGLTFHLQHFIPVSKVWQYKATALARQMLEAYLADISRSLHAEMGKYRARVILRSHAHYCVDVGYTSTRGFVLPCWQATSPFMAKLGPLALRPEIGFVGFQIEGGEYAFHKETRPIEAVQEPPHTVYRKRGELRSNPRAARRDRRKQPAHKQGPDRGSKAARPRVSRSRTASKAGQ